MDLICQKCLTGRSDSKLGDPCPTPGCDGVIEEEPAYSTLVDVLPEPMTCLRRMREFGPWDYKEGLDRWEKFKKNGDRVCSFCGSLHPNDYFAIAKAAAEASPDAEYHSVPEIEQSDKGYKIYVHRPGVRNAHEGGIKFYTHHLPRNEKGELEVPPERHDEFRRALRASSVRFQRYMNVQFPQPQTRSVQ